MNMKKLLLFSFVLVGLTQNANANLFEEIVGGVVVGGAAVVCAPFALTYAGFTATGVAAGSLAAGWQATIGERGFTLFILL